MIDWLSSMQQTFEYYVVNPDTWKDEKLIDNVISCTINRDSEAETLGCFGIFRRMLHKSLLDNNSKWSKRKASIGHISCSNTIFKL